jgi:F-type H+-transporting ATPase subunit delta
MKETRVASRYASSLLDLAISQNELEKVKEDVRRILAMLHDSRDLRTFLESPVVAADKKIGVLKTVFEGVTPTTMAFLSLLAKKKREGFAENIFREFYTLYNDHKGIQKAIVTTAVGLDDNLRKQVNELIRKQTNSEVELVEVIDKNLIGGFTLKFGDKQIDSSIARSLSKLKRALGDNPFNNKI